MNLSKELRELLLSENEEDCRLGFEIAKRMNIKASLFMNLEMEFIDENGYVEHNYMDMPIYTIICDYLDSIEVTNIPYYKWTKWLKEDV